MSLEKISRFSMILSLLVAAEYAGTAYGGPGFGAMGAVKTLRKKLEKDFAVSFDVPPRAPSQLGAVAVGATRVDLSWADNGDNEREFRIERQLPDGAMAEVAVVPWDITSYSDTGLSEGTFYLYRVSAWNEAGGSSPSNEAEARTRLFPPADLRGEVRHGVVQLTWTDRSEREAGYRIERRLSEGEYDVVDTVPADVVVYGDAGFSPEASYVYRVTAVESLGFQILGLDASSDPSNEAFLTSPPFIAAPGDLRASVTEAGWIELSWTDRSSNEAGFRIERSTSPEAYAGIGFVSADVASYLDLSVSTSTTYNYRLFAFKGAAASPYSNEARATTPAVLDSPRLPPEALPN
jgi:uncharacterized protein